MPLKTNIIGGRTGNLEVDIVDGSLPDRFKPRGLITYDLPYEVEVNAPRYATNGDSGTDMAVNGTSTGASDNIHNGIDNVYWTAAATSGTWDFSSTTQANSGAQSIDATATVDGDVATLTRASSIDPATYNSLEGAIYVDSWSGSGTKEVRFQFQLAGVAVGNVVDLSGYINTSTTGSWQSFIIPLSAFALPAGNIDELTITTVDVGGGPPPNYYLDDLLLQAASAGTGPQTYTLEPDSDEILRVYGFSWTIVDAYTPNAGTGNIQSLSYNKFGDLTQLSNGVLTRRIQGGNTLFTNTANNHADIISGANAEVKEHWYDGTNVYLKTYTRFAQPVDLNGKSGDRYEFVVQDNLSGLEVFNIRADASLVTRPDMESL
jgi:hypothetical protein